MAIQEAPTARSLSNRIHRLLLINGLAVVILLIVMSLLATIIHRQDSLSKRLAVLEAAFGTLGTEATTPPPLD